MTNGSNSKDYQANELTLDKANVDRLYFIQHTHPKATNLQVRAILIKFMRTIKQSPNP